MHSTESQIKSRSRWYGRTAPLRLFALAAALALAPACGHRAPAAKAAPKGPLTPPPKWLSELTVGGNKLCGVGVAGKAWNDDGRYPQELSQKRAIENLAGVLGTSVQEAIIDRETHRGIGVEMARVLTVDEALVDEVAGLAETQFWFDVDGTGPFRQAGFTYALSCVDAAKAESALKLPPDSIRPQKKLTTTDAEHLPDWIDRTGKQPGGRLCAVGFSLPMFFPERTFEAVVEDIRGQLAVVVETLVASYYEELTTNRAQAIESTTMATTQALATGVVVTHFWYDADGIGPLKRDRSTYGWGCIYPVAMLQKSAPAPSEPSRPPPTTAEVREHAEAAFDALDAEILKRSSGTGTSMPSDAAPTAP